jgi:hypothetical protein
MVLDISWLTGVRETWRKRQRPAIALHFACQKVALHSIASREGHEFRLLAMRIRNAGISLDASACHSLAPPNMIY